MKLRLTSKIIIATAIPVALAIILMMVTAVMAAPKVGSIDITTPQDPSPVGPGHSCTYGITVYRDNINGSSGSFTVDITATDLPDGATYQPASVTFHPTDDSVSTIFTIQTLANTPVGTHNITIIATNTGITDNFVSVNGTLVIETKIDPVITWMNPADITYPEPLSETQLNATADVPGVFTYTPSSGTVLDAGERTLHVDFVPTDTTIYNDASEDVTINVLKATPVVTWANPADITHGTALSDTQLNATADVDGVYTYTPPSGTVLSTGAGQILHVDFVPTDTNNYHNASEDVTINVLKATPVITWADPEDITYGTALSTTQLNATADVEGVFIYTPPSGTVLYVGVGQILHVDFMPTDTTNYNDAYKNVYIDVLGYDKTTPVITWADPADITYPEPLSDTQLNATSDVDGSFTYTPDIGTVLNAGADQILHVDFVPTDETNYHIASRDVTINVLKATPVITWANPADITYPEPLSETQLNATADVDGIFTYSPPIGTVPNAGADQILHVDFVPADTTNYNDASQDVTIYVHKATPVITWKNPADITYGIALSATQLNATADVAGVFTYTPDIGTVLDASVGGQTLHIDFLPTDMANYHNASRDVTINVLKATPVITWVDADITYGTALSATQLNATADVDGIFTYTPSSGTVLNAGVGQTLHVDFVPTDTTNYNNASRDVTINVLKATPVIKWADPADITYPEPLGAAQLNATADVPGVFTYNPPSGTVLNAGEDQTLHVDFVPTDTINYNSCSKDTKINVNKSVITPSDITITSVSPNKGAQDKEIGVIITGDYFTGATAVSFGSGIIINSFNVDSSTQITANIAISGVATLGTRNVLVTASSGTATLTGGFTVVAMAGDVTAGSEVTVALGDVRVSFQTVTADGSVTVTLLAGNPAGELPDDFEVVGLFLDITTTATHNGPVSLAVEYDELGISSENDLRLFHWNGSIWEDVTTSVDTENNLIYGEVTTLSPFFIGQSESKVELPLKAWIAIAACGFFIIVAIVYVVRRHLIAQR